jgi:hypothetical protein
MIAQRAIILAALTIVLSACASNPPRPVKSQFEDIPVPKGMAYRPTDSTVIETPSVSAGREVYRGRLEMESLAVATRTTLEANGWRHVGTTKTAQHGIMQVYEKQGTPLQVLLWEGIWFTYAEYTTARILQQTQPTQQSQQLQFPR